MKFKPHTFSVDTNERSAVYFYIAILSILFAYFLYWSQGTFEFEIPWWLETPSVLGFYTLIFSLFERYLWKLKFLRYVLSIKTPVLNKSYKVSLMSSYDNFENSMDAEIFVEQSYMKILIRLQTANSISESQGAFFCLKDSTDPSLTYEFVSKPNSTAAQTMHIHHGMGTIYFDREKIQGEYFNGRGRQQFGRFEER